jgi:adenylate kinase family enzyme
MRRVVILGPGGAGKSTLARELGARTGLPVFHLDRYYWKPGWVPTPDDEWAARQRELFAGDRWIADGNYSRTLHERLARADTIVLLDFSPWRTVTRILRRTTRNHGRAIQADGCPERYDWEFTRWVATYRRRSRPRVLAAIERDARHADLQVFRSPREVSTWLEPLGGTLESDT